MEHVFKTKSEFKEEIANVFNFFGTCKNTIIAYIEKNGSIEIPEDEEDEWYFNFLELGLCQISSICIDRNDVCLKAKTYNGDCIDIFWDELYYDIYIVQSIMNKIFEEK